jgi:PAS domain S-box-containing protein
MRILLVDDDNTYASFLKLLLTTSDNRFSYQFEWRNDYQTALDAITTGSYDLCLLDYSLGTHTGIELLTTIRAAGYRLPVIMLTARNDEETDRAAMNAGADDYLIKGEFDRKLLERSIRYAVEGRRSAEALIQSEQRLHALIANAPAIIFVTDADGVTTLLDGKGITLPPEVARSMIGQSVFERFRDYPKVIEEMRRVLSGEDREGVVELLDRYYEYRITPLRGADGGVTGVIGVANNVTASRAAEERIRFQAHLLDLIGQAAYAVDANLNITFWNRYAEHLYGWTSEELLGRNINEFAPDERTPEQVMEARAAIQRGEAWTGEFIASDRSGRRFPVMVTNTPILDENGAFNGGISISTDITERRAAEDALRASEQLFKDFVDNTPAIFFIRDASHRFVFANHRYGEMFSRTPDGLIGRTPGDLLPAETADSFIAADDAILQGARVHERIQQMKINGEDRYWHIVVFPIHGVEGKTMVGGTGMEITGQVKAEQALREAHSVLEVRVAERTVELHQALVRLEQSSALQKQFIADASHDLRSPMTVVRGELELLLNRTDIGNGRMRESLQRAILGAERLDRLTNDLLLLARLDADSYVITRRTIRLDELLVEAITTLAQLSREKNITWRIDVAESVEIEGDRSALERAITNVLENAVKYSPDDRVVQVSLTSTETFATVVVADTGFGIPPEDFPPLFDRFFRGDRTRSTEGTGLGLPITKSVLEAHGGLVQVESEVGRGTTVTMVIPVRSQNNTIS